ncbi:hypothetical protein ACFS07_19515 [Undibacterium arcticum]|uniref:Transposase n=2 Tax=Undibacterium arcticum TaxID=1762892 RepID=A0ABV7EUP9_9BURK
MLPLNEQHRIDIARVRGQIWDLYADLSITAAKAISAATCSNKRSAVGTRSDLGRKCRDTFSSLKKTCRKLGISFWSYLIDRISCSDQIPSLLSKHE